MEENFRKEVRNMSKENEFEVMSFIEKQKGDTQDKEPSSTEGEEERFNETCELVGNILSALEKEESKAKPNLILDRQKRALLGYEEEIIYYKNQIKDIVKQRGLANAWHPAWYQSIHDAIYNEIFGFAGLTEWIEGRTEELANSSTAKTIGNRIYFMVNGEMIMQPQKLSRQRRKQLRTALLLATPEKRAQEVYHEVYLLDGTRVTMYNEGLAKHDQDSIVYRKFFVKNYTFDEQAARHTIPEGGIPLFKSMVDIGYNIAIIGAVKTSKTTWLTTWQSYEDPKLEGVMIETDPEIPLHIIMPKAAIMQFVPREEDLPFVVKKIMRSDADYIIMAEARDGIALGTAVKAANKGTSRVKMTFHTKDALDFCYDVADEIVKTDGGNLGTTITKVAKSFQYIFQFIQLADKSKKRLKAVWEIRYDLKKRQITMHQICKYDYEKDNWSWAYDIGSDQRSIGYEQNTEALSEFESTLKRLAKEFPMEEDNIYIPSYDHLIRGGMA